MAVTIPIKRILVRKIYKAKLPLGYGKTLDLDRLDSEAALYFDGSNGAEVKYDPQVPPYNLVIRTNGISFCIFNNGTVIIPSLEKIGLIQQNMNSLWEKCIINAIVPKKPKPKCIL